MAKKKKSAAATAALAVLQDAGVHFEVREYEHTAGETNFGVEAAQKLGRSPEQVFKTLMIHHEKDFAVCVVPVGGKLNLKAAAAALGWKTAMMADPAVAQKRTGYVVGGISPLGQKISHPTLVDESAQLFDTVLVSGGKRGLDVELTGDNLVEVTAGSYADIAAS
ncbi:Cys-tRNA(Pro) deacylase [Rothia endophytica]|uniref:Cys-tRNA(Pro) deacylase n=1 Tax=Rothia endophytica TaxID=1324766 RepID=UPI001F00BD37|nr:Cys-tRNA(Pro) deacylase [Rothia endophytica]